MNTLKSREIQGRGQYFWVAAILFTVQFLGCAIVKDFRKPMWTDELLTLYASQQPGTSGILRATMEFDQAPPLYAIMVRAILPLVPPQVAVRLPSTLGYCAMFLCLLAFCRQRLPPLYAWAAALLTCVACVRYASEGRSYGMVLGCAAGGLLCWQAAVKGRNRSRTLPLLALCLALMTALHYYAVFVLVPLLVAEVFRWHADRKPDLGILAAMIPVPLVLGLHYPLIAAAQPFLRHFWSPAVWSQIPQFYDEYFVPMLISCLLPVGVLVVTAAMPGRWRASLPTLSLYERIAVGLLSLMPPGVVALSKYTTHAFVDRYVVWAVPALGILIAAVLCWSACGHTAVGLTLVALLMVQAVSGELRDLRQKPVLLLGEGLRQALARLPDGTEPILIPDVHPFMELSYYAKSRIRERLIYPLSQDLELHYSGNDTASLSLSGLSHRSKLAIIDYDAVLAAHPRFILAALPTNYMASHLARTGYHLMPIGSSPNSWLYEVEAPGTR